MITINNLTKTYNKTDVVNSISFEINKGDIFGLLGPNGAGKTTIIKMLTGQKTPTSGTVSINGVNIQNKSDLYYDIGVVFELPNLYNNTTIRKNLELFAKIYSLDSSRVDEVIEDLQLKDKEQVTIDKLSKGWKQRVLIARALLHNPKILILDEPTSGLDPNTANLLHDHIRKLNEKGITIIITTHDMNEADLLCNKVAIIDKGVIKAIGSPSELKQQYYRDDIVINYIDDGIIQTKTLLFSEPESKALIIELLEQDKLINYYKQIISLADVFYYVTGGVLS